MATEIIDSKMQNGVFFQLAKLFTDNYPTTDDYISSDAYEIKMFSTILICIENNGLTNALKYKIEASIDGTKWYTLVSWYSNTTLSDIVLAANSITYETITDAWSFLKVSVASNVGSSSTYSQVYISGKSS